MGRSMEGVSAYSARARGGEGKTSVSAVGGVQSPYGGKPPYPPKRLLHSRFASATHYKTEIFVDGTRADAVDLPDMQIFKT